MVEAASSSNTIIGSRAFTSAPPLDNAVLKRRLLQGVGAGTAARGSLSKCALKYRDFVTRYQDAEDTNADAVEASKHDLVRELNLYQVEMMKVGLSVQAASADAEQIDAERASVVAQIAAVQGDIQALQMSHPEAKQARRNMEEYEALAKMANTRPSRRILERKKAKIDAELKAVEESVRSNREEKVLREKQFHLFMQSLFDLKESLAEDVEKQKEAEQGEDNSDDDDSDDDDSDDEGEVKSMDTS